jgi:hypothetical protein
MCDIVSVFGFLRGANAEVAERKTQKKEQAAKKTWQEKKQPEVEDFPLAASHQASCA